MHMHRKERHLRDIPCVSNVWLDSLVCESVESVEMEILNSDPPTSGIVMLSFNPIVATGLSTLYYW